MSIQAVCSKCGAGLKYPVTIGGKIFGTSCASKHLGINDIPNQYTGSYEDLQKRKEQLKKEEEAKRKEWELESARKQKLRAEWKPKFIEQCSRMREAYKKASKVGFEWKFIMSITEQAGLTISKDPTMENDLVWSQCWNEPRWIESLSEKQIAILERIENK